jgi:hypothetical protein
MSISASLIPIELQTISLICPLNICLPQAAAKAAKKDAKMAKMLQEEELRILFNEGTIPP